MRWCSTPMDNPPPGFANVDLKAFTDEFYHRLTDAHPTPMPGTPEYIVRDAASCKRQG
ncbi:MAG: hypothetical protein M0P11_08005 [Anaerolineaceae bacterium]|nr:hypothetical protein [Anaerolineaceae bacterium]